MKNKKNNEPYIQHLRQLDPTEIVLIPIPLDRLFLSSSAVAFVTVLSSSSSSFLLSSSSSSSYNDRLLLQKVLDVLQLTIVVALTMFLCGASPYANIEHTFLAALFLSSLIAMDLPFDNLQQQQQESRQAMRTTETTMTNTTSPILDNNILWRISPSSSSTMSTTPHDGWLCQIRGHCTVAITIVCQILLLYDRGWQIQRWPVPTILGSAIGWTLGVLVSVILFPILPDPLYYYNNHNYSYMK